MDQPADGIARSAWHLVLGWCRGALDGHHALGHDEQSFASYGPRQREPSPDDWLHRRAPVACVAIRRCLRRLPPLASVPTGTTVVCYVRIWLSRTAKFGLLVGLLACRYRVYHPEDLRLHSFPIASKPGLENSSKSRITAIMRPLPTRRATPGPYSP